MNNTIRNAVLVVIALVAVSLLAHKFSGAATTTSTAPVRNFYLTKTTHDGSHVLGVCATGYHVASIWEIHEPTMLSYNKSLGVTQADSGGGPPTGAQGWARTGYVASTSSNIGVGNCNAWTSDSSSDYGTTLQLGFPSLQQQLIDPWYVVPVACSNTNFRVWCVEN
jgi:hypothetical protein